MLGIGIISVSDFHIDFLYLGISVLVLGIFIWIYWKNKIFRFVLLCILFLVLGFFRYIIAIPQDSEKNIVHYAGQRMKVVGYVSSEPDVRLDGVRYIVETQNIASVQQRNNAHVETQYFASAQHDSNKIHGKIYFKSQLYPRYAYGDKLELNCSLRAPEPVEDFRYDKYLARYRVFVICQEAKIKKIGYGEGSRFLRSVFGVKQVVAERINIIWHEPYASFMAGLLYGYRGGLGELNELFSRTGVTHIVAISGYNITIIATILITMCTHLYIPRKKAFWIIVIGIAVFVIFAGASASVVRAGIMGIIVLLAKQVGRASKVGNVMMLTAVIMSLQNPYILMWDAGFQLSFISTLGLVYLVPVIERPFIKLPEAFGMKESLVTTLAAIAATLPLILYQFGRLSIVAPVVNILILWILPWIMAIGFFTVVISFVFKPLAIIMSWIAWIGMEYIVIIVRWFANLRFAAADVSFPIWVMFVLYVVMIFVVVRKSKGS
ncbi:DUF4131 domain-containing protein [Candidatus Parcubacteria bacterium]|nr:DUF4131 domain-containing protein [Candidatus Parcubacteria bacterium]